MGRTTVPAIENAISKKQADQIIETLERMSAGVDAYARAWGNDWGVEITHPDKSDEELHEEYHSMYYLGLLTPP